MKSIRYIFGILIFSYATNCSAQWTQEANYPSGIDDEAVAFTIGDTVYVGGGSIGSTSFYKYDPSTGLWTAKANLPRQCAAGVSFVIGSKGYMALGQSDPTSQTNAQASVTSDLWEYDPVTDTWTQKANFPGQPRDAAFAFVIGDIAYVGGGVDNTGNNAFSDFYSYDSSSDTWNTLGDLPDYTYFSSAFTIGNYGYVATGYSSVGDNSYLWQYDTSGDNWNQMPNFPGPARDAAVAFTLNGLGYVGLGETGYSTVFSDFYSYNPTDSVWTKVTSFPGTYGRGWAVGIATSSAAFVGLGTDFGTQDTALYGNNDFWMFAPSAEVTAATPVSNPNAYPNPAINFVNLSLPIGVSSAHVTVQNAIAVTCLTTEIGSDGRVDVSSLPAGIYNIEITSGEYHAVQHIVKE
jgi:N-acetylneuraminic acid mutarotase